MSKRVLAIILSGIMMITGMGCSGAAGLYSKDSDASGQADKGGFQISEDMKESADRMLTLEQDKEEGFDTSGYDLSEHVIITYLTIGDRPEGKAAERLRETITELNEILGDELNAELNIDFIGWEDYLDKYNEKIALKDGSVDLVGASTEWLDGWNNVKKGAFLPLTEGKIKKYAPKTYESVPKEHWDMCKYEDKIYFLPEDNYTQWTNHGFTYRMDFAREAGLKTGIHSWDDMTDYFTYVRDHHPELKCLWDADVSNYKDLTEGFITSHSDFVAIDSIAAQKLWGGTKDDPYTIYVPVMDDTDIFVEFANTMKKWDRIGVWPSDVMTRTENENRQEYRKGLVAVDQHHTQSYANLCSNNEENLIYKDNPEAESGFFYFGEERDNLVSSKITHGAMAISAGSKNPERALMVYDMLRNNKDCYRLICYGIKGISYEINAEGLRVKPEGFDPETDSVYEMTNFWWGRNDELELRDAEINWDVVDELYASYDKKKYDYPYGQFVADETEISAKIEKCTQIYENYMKQIAFGKFDKTAEAVIEQMQHELALEGIDDVTAAIQAQIDALYK